MKTDRVGVDNLPPKAVAAVLGPTIGKLVIKEMALRDGFPLPPPRDPKETSPDVLSLRAKTSIHAYSLWAATFTFQKLVVSIKLALEKFQPSHRGAVMFLFTVLTSIL
jgi:hypothetical protein